MLCGGAAKGRAQLVNSATREPVHGSTMVANDDWLLALSITDVELTGAKIYFTAKTCVDNPDAMTGDFKLSSDEPTEILVSANNGNPNRLDATIRVPYTATAIAFPPDAMSVTYWFDVQIVRAGTPTNAPKRQTYFRGENCYFKVTRDITLNLTGTLP